MSTYQFVGTYFDVAVSRNAGLGGRFSILPLAAFKRAVLIRSSSHKIRRPGSSLVTESPKHSFCWSLRRNLLISFGTPGFLSRVNRFLVEQFTVFVLLPDLVLSDFFTFLRAFLGDITVCFANEWG